MLRVLPAIALFAVWVISPGARVASTREVASIYADAPSFWSTAKPSEYQLTVDGVAVPPIRVVPGPHPVSALVMLDASSSVPRPPVADVAKRLAADARNGDVFRIATFAKRFLLSQPFDNHPGVAAERAREVEQHGGPSPLWDSLYVAVTEVASATGVRAVLVASDGMATGNDRAFGEVEDLTTRTTVIVSVVGVDDDSLYFPSQIRAVGRNDGLRRLTQNSGGHFFAFQKKTPARAGSDPPEFILAAMVNQLRKRYRIDFEPPARDGRLHEVRVTIGGRPVAGPTRLVF